jgi:hypothetical protein
LVTAYGDQFVAADFAAKSVLRTITREYHRPQQKGRKMADLLPEPTTWKFIGVCVVILVLELVIMLGLLWWHDR